MKLSFNKGYFLLTILLFLVEVLIALYVNDSFVRPYVGDFLVVILVYCFVRSFVDAPYVRVALAVLIFAYAVEVTQYFRLVHYLGLAHSKVAHAVFGSAFEWVDLVAYTLGILVVIGIEKIRNAGKTNLNTTE